MMSVRIRAKLSSFYSVSLTQTSVNPTTHMPSLQNRHYVIFLEPPPLVIILSELSETCICITIQPKGVPEIAGVKSV